MEKLIVILSVIIFLIAMSLFAFMKYRDYQFNKKSTPDMIQILRESRKTLNRLSYEERNSTYGRLLVKSIIALESELKKRANA